MYYILVAAPCNIFLSENDNISNRDQAITDIAIFGNICLYRCRVRLSILLSINHPICEYQKLTLVYLICLSSKLTFH